MQIIRHYADWPAALSGGVVAIGNFDGFHKGHQAITSQLIHRAREQKRPAVVMTFEPHPRRFFQPHIPRLRLFPFHRKAQWFADAGIDAMLVQRFNDDFSALEASDFVRHVLVDALGAAIVMTGADFSFGRERQGNPELLQQIARDSAAFRYEAIEPIGTVEGKFSSSGVRTALAAGDMVSVAHMLGRAYDWRGRVVHGDQRGRTIGFPTANLMPPPVCHPRYGVYAVRGECEGRYYHGVANWGMRPTFDGVKPVFEAHWFDMNDDLYGRHLRVEWVAHLRDEQRFDGVDALKQQIMLDCEQARKVLV